MSLYRCLPALLILGGLTGCCNNYHFAECQSRPARLVDVNSERGDAWGRNFYVYKAHELHPDQMRRYDYHPPYYHRFAHEEDRN